MVNKITIGITDCGKYANYEKWILAAPNTVEVIKLSTASGNAADVAVCDGIVLTGGEDVHPSRYGKHEYLSMLNPKEIDEKRDAFEYEVLKIVFNQNKPLLGICRGLQLTNVFLGGTLVPDIPTATGIQVHGKINGVDQRHDIEIKEGTMLANIGSTRGEVNSAHHQAIEVAGPGLRITARDKEGIVEGAEWADPSKKNWMLLVQWHPERMHDQENPFAAGIRNAFITNILKNQYAHH